MDRDWRDPAVVTAHRAAVGQRLETALTALKMKPVDVRKKYGIKTGSHVTAWLTGDSYPPEAWLSLFCEDFDISTDWFLRGVLGGTSSVMQLKLEAAAASPLERRWRGRPRGSKSAAKK
jgi:hypothetical protein